MADSTEIILDNLTTKMTEVFSRTQTSSSPIIDSPMVPISIKLDGSNYGLWSEVVEMYISGKDKLGYINGDYSQPPETDPSFRKWRTENAMVKGWLINSMDHSLVVNFIRYPTAKQVWDSAATTYFDGTDTSQVYELRRRVSRMKQARGSIEKYYNDLQDLWREIDFRRPNPMKCALDINSYNSILQEEQVYTFLDGLDDRLDHVRSDVLRLKPFLSIEQAYAHIRREDLRQSVMISGAEAVASGAVMAIKGMKSRQSHKSGCLSDGNKCTHCGSTKHTRETCFKLHGYPDWWHELQAKKKRDAPATEDALSWAAVATAGSQLSLIPMAEHSTTTPDQGGSQQGDYWVGNILDRKSTLGYFTFVGGNLVTWRSKKQKVVALSTAEAEFRGMAKGLCELLWLRGLLTEVGFPPDSAMNLFCDNKAAIDISHNPIQHDRTKHVEIDQHFIKQNLEEKIIQFSFVKFEDQLADILTKAVSSRNFNNSLDKLGVRDIYTPI